MVFRKRKSNSSKLKSVESPSPPPETLNVSSPSPTECFNASPDSSEAEMELDNRKYSWPTDSFSTAILYRDNRYFTL